MSSFEFLDFDFYSNEYSIRGPSLPSGLSLSKSSYYEEYISLVLNAISIYLSEALIVTRSFAAAPSVLTRYTSAVLASSS